jgi:restriction system protein
MTPLFETSSDLPDLSETAELVLEGALHALRSFWPFFVLIGLIAAARFAYQLYRLRRLSRSGIAEIDQMDGATFEHFLGTLFRRLGYRVELTNHRGDYGADLVVTKDGRRTAVQAKRWTKRVGVKAVQEAVASKGYYGCDGALVVANREFTEQARTLARANDVELWGREVLVAKLLTVQDDQAEGGAPAPATPTDVPMAEPVAPPTPAAEVATCATCGRSVSAKVRDYCLARPQRFGGLVYCFAHQRSAPD